MAAKRKPVKSQPEGALTVMLDALKETDGGEIPREQWPIAEALAARGLITLGSARGPGGYWRRAELAVDMQMQREVFEEVQAEAAADAAALGETLPAPILPALESTLARFATIGRKLRELPIDPPLAPPVPGVEPATAFAERLARKLIVFGDPPAGLVIEILRAVRERDAAIVKAKDDERDGC